MAQPPTATATEIAGSLMAASRRWNALREWQQAPEPATVTEWMHVAARQHLALPRNVNATTAILIGYGPAVAVPPVIDTLTPHVEAAGITVLDALRVTHGIASDDRRPYAAVRCQPTINGDHDRSCRGSA
ncbi:hypothetical protein [Micromonospora psammae]|uniref:hypothetical protein n=1 Tax=Micromonospora sp. CPCC 205556 TaxID=3122398 RepID=UPI002FF1830E